MGTMNPLDTRLATGVIGGRAAKLSEVRMFTLTSFNCDTFSCTRLILSPPYLAREVFTQYSPDLGVEARDAPFSLSLLPVVPSWESVIYTIAAVNI